MNVLRASHLGMCFGVRNAIALALDRAAQRPITVLGDLVHNPDVLATLRLGGVHTAREIDQVRTTDVLVTAHGVSERRLRAVHKRGLVAWEATCPLVRAAHRAALALVAEGWHPVVIGRADHVEVRGLTEDLPAFDVVLEEADIGRLPERPRWGVIAQTTQPIERVRHLVAVLRARFPTAEVRFVDTVCQPTKLRQAAAIELAQQCDVVVVIGGSGSNNTRELAATCQRQGARVYHVQGAEDLQADWFNGVERVGVTAGTSTPDDVIKEVERRLRALAADEETAADEAATDARSAQRDVELHAV